MQAIYTHARMERDEYVQPRAVSPSLLSSSHTQIFTHFQRNNDNSYVYCKP